MTDEYDPRLSIQGDGPPVILVPGMNGSGELFYQQLPRLQRSYRAVTYSLRDDAESLSVLASDLAHIIDTISPDDRRAIVIGESFGGAVALTTALEQPDRVAALVILNSFPHFDPQFRLNLAIAGIRAIPWGAMTLVRRATAFRLHSRHTHGAEVNRFLALTARATRAGYLNRLRLLRHYNVRHRLHEIRQPTLLLAAELDHLVPSVVEGRFMADRVPGSVLRILAGHGHICLIAPDLDLADILDEWGATDYVHR